MEQTGFIESRPRPTDYLAGALPWKRVVSDGSWEKFLPDGERQNVPFEFDTMACVTFSALNTIESQLKVFKLPESHLTFLRDNGYFKNDQINFSDKFTAIISGTTKQGNTFTNVADAIRNYGLIPDSVLPFGGEQTFDAWHSPAQITDEMRALGKKFLDYFDIGYEWVLVNDNKKIDEQEENTLRYHLFHAPLQIAVPYTARHAIMMSSFYRIFESYPPFDRPGKDPISYAFKIVITPKNNESITRTLSLGTTGTQVTALQKLLNQYVPMPITGTFDSITLQAVKVFQGGQGLVPDGIVGPKTRSCLGMPPTVPIVNFRMPGDDIFGCNPYLLAITQRVRTETGIPLKVTSGKRTEQENSKADGVANSSHLSALAFDFGLLPDKHKVVCDAFRRYGVKRFGYYKDHLHIDIDFSKPQVEWNY